MIDDQHVDQRLHAVELQPQHVVQRRWQKNDLLELALDVVGKQAGYMWATDLVTMPEHVRSAAQSETLNRVLRH